MFWHSQCAVCTVTVRQSLVESLLEKVCSNNRSFLRVSACQLQAFEQFFFSVMPLSLKGIQPAFHKSVLHTLEPNEMVEQKRRNPKPVTVAGREKWEVEEVLKSRSV
ncbi:uncharacterized protein VP01_632g6 [Puccinia sorghi]|uniref:Uncharacterized protein n=1 Tax=Puccinia sorghi TaxID=27349 RepID=A0A0L6UG73_9BASI|nr:uncharacterized protein VP01_632g6 [Puccinia sorghi]